MSHTSENLKIIKPTPPHDWLVLDVNAAQHWCNHQRSGSNLPNHFHHYSPQTPAKLVFFLISRKEIKKDATKL